MRRLVLVLSIVSTVALAVLASVVHAHTQKYATKISAVERTAIEGGYRYSGSLTSANPHCAKHRGVTVAIPPAASQRTHTDSARHWKVDSPIGGSVDITVSVRSKLLPRNGADDKQFCKDAVRYVTFTDQPRP
jgi:hypothetical protein